MNKVKQCNIRIQYKFEIMREGIWEELDELLIKSVKELGFNMVHMDISLATGIRTIDFNNEPPIKLCPTCGNKIKHNEGKDE